MIGLIILADVWFLLWIIHGCTIEKMLKEILAEIKKPKEGYREERHSECPIKTLENQKK